MLEPITLNQNLFYVKGECSIYEILLTRGFRLHINSKTVLHKLVEFALWYHGMWMCLNITQRVIPNLIRVSLIWHRFYKYVVKHKTLKLSNNCWQCWKDTNLMICKFRVLYCFPNVCKWFRYLEAVLKKHFGKLYIAVYMFLAYLCWSFQSASESWNVINFKRYVLRCFEFVK